MNPELTISPAWTEWVYQQIDAANRAAASAEVRPPVHESGSPDP